MYLLLQMISKNIMANQLIKMTALDKFKREGGGQIDAEKYNSFVKKLVAMGKAAQGKSIESIMGESYTVHYLSLLR